MTMRWRFVYKFIIGSVVFAAAAPVVAQPLQENFLRIVSPYVLMADRHGVSDPAEMPVPRANAPACFKAYEDIRKISQLHDLVTARMEQTQAIVAAEPAVYQRRISDEYRATLSGDLRYHVAETVDSIAVLPYCRGLYLQTDYAIYCSDEESPRNGFCGAGPGQPPEGVFLTDDDQAFGRALSREMLAHLATKGNDMTLSRFKVAAFQNFDGTTYTATDGDRNSEAELPDLASRAWVRLYRRTASEAGGLLSQGWLGDPDAQMKAAHWKVVIEPAQYESVEVDELGGDPEAASALGLELRFGPFIQLPRLRIAIELPHHMIAGNAAVLSVEDKNGRMVGLTTPLSLIPPDTLSGRFGAEASSTSWLWSFPVAEEWRTIRAAEGGSLIVGIPILMPDGSREQLDIRAPLFGLEQALKTFAAIQQEIAAEYHAGVTRAGSHD
ncbi:MAG: hypothetical protein CMK70_01945 [Pseudohongiella sp.]|nr:hypothetical protein [Pseudohongiella sp.]